MKNSYEKPDFYVSCFELENIITLSGGSGSGGGIETPDLTFANDANWQ